MNHGSTDVHSTGHERPRRAATLAAMLMRRYCFALVVLIQGCGIVGGAPLGTELLLRDRQTGHVVACTVRSECERHYRDAGLECFAELQRLVQSPRMFTVRQCTE